MVLTLAQLPLDAIKLIVELLECSHLAYLLATGDKVLAHKLDDGIVTSLYCTVGHGRLPAWPRNLVNRFRSITSFSLIGLHEFTPLEMYTEEDLRSLPSNLRHLHIEDRYEAASVIRPSKTPNAVSWRATSSDQPEPHPHWKYFNFSQAFPALKSLNLHFWKQGDDAHLDFLHRLPSAITSLDIIDTNLELWEPAILLLPTTLTRLIARVGSVGCATQALHRFPYLEYLSITLTRGPFNDQFMRALRPPLKALLLNQQGTEVSFKRLEDASPLPSSLTHLGIIVDELTSQGLASLPRIITNLELAHKSEYDLVLPLDASAWPPQLTALKWTSVSVWTRYHPAETWVETLPRSITRLELPEDIVFRSPSESLNHMPSDLMQWDSLPWDVDEVKCEDCNFSPNAIAILGRLTDIQGYLTNPNVLPHLTAVRSLDLAGLSASEFLTHFQTYKSLTYLRITSEVRMEDAMLAALPRSLRTLTVPCASEIGNSRLLPPSLTNLGCTMLKTSPTNAFIETLPNDLITLHLGPVPAITRDALKSLPKRLRSLWLGGFTGILDEDIAALPRSLISLSLPDTGEALTKAAAKLLPPFLQALSLDRLTSWTNDCMAQLPRCLTVITLPKISQFTEGLESYIPPFLSLLSTGRYPTLNLPPIPDSETQCLFIADQRADAETEEEEAADGEASGIAADQSEV